MHVALCVYGLIGWTLPEGFLRSMHTYVLGPLAFAGIRTDVLLHAYAPSSKGNFNTDFIQKQGDALTKLPGMRIVNNSIFPLPMIKIV